MKIDLAALLAASGGDQTRKVTVTKAWLRAVHDELAKQKNREELRKRIDGLGDKLGALYGTGRKA